MLVPATRRTTRNLGFLSLPEYLRNFIDHIQKLLSFFWLTVVFALASLFRSFPELVVEIWILFYMLRLEVVGPEYPEVMLDELTTLFLDKQRADTIVALKVLHLIHDSLNALRLNLCLRGVINTARQITMRIYWLYKR